MSRYVVELPVSSALADVAGAPASLIESIVRTVGREEGVGAFVYGSQAVPSADIADLAARWREASASIRNDGTPAQVGLSAEECDEAAIALEAIGRERDEAFSANERDRSIVSEVRTEFNVSLARRSWLLDGRGSYEWDDDRWKTEFAAAIEELGTAIRPLEKIGIDWSLCPTNPDEIAEARIDWKARAITAEAALSTANAEVERLKSALTAMLSRFELYAGANDMHAGQHDLALLKLARSALQADEVVK